MAAPMDGLDSSPLSNPDLLERALLFCSHRELELRAALVCRAWLEVARGRGMQPVLCHAFWLYHATQDENTLGQFEPAAPLPPGAGPVDWRAECRYRRAACFEGWTSAQSRMVCEMVGDVVWAVAATLPSDLYICGGEAGTIYFIDTEERDTSKAILFSFEAHEATIRSISVVRTGAKPQATYRVASMDVAGNLIWHDVDPLVKKTATCLGRMVFGGNPTRMELLPMMTNLTRDLDDMYAAVAFEHGHIQLMGGYGNATIDASEFDLELAGLDYIDNLRVVTPVSFGDEPVESLTTMIVSGALKPGVWVDVWITDWVVPHDEDEEETYPSSVRRRIARKLEEDEDSALPSNTAFGFARDGTVAVGFGDGSVRCYNVLDSDAPAVRTNMHQDEVWDVSIAGDMVVSSGRDRRVMARTRKGRELFSRDAGWVVNVKATPNRMFLLGFDGVLHVLERNV